jgi:hypothetical protein
MLVPMGSKPGHDGAEQKHARQSSWTFTPKPMYSSFLE